MFSSIDPTTLIIMVMTMAAAGAISGVLAGLFGIGGGAVLVPVLIEFLAFQGVAPSVTAHIAIGTSLAIIAPTSVRSFRSHLARGAPDTELLKLWIIWVPLGVTCAAIVVAQISGASLKIIFAFVATLIGIKMLLNRSDWILADNLPSKAWQSFAGFFIGVISTFMGIGGGNLNNAFMTSFGRPIHQAVATSAGLGTLIAVPGVLGYIWAGWGNPDLPSFSLGFISLLGIALTLPTSLLCAPIGAKLAHALDKRQMEIAFGLFLLLVAARMFWTAF